jgi:nicotinamidase-related amidase
MNALLIVDLQAACFTEAKPRLDRPGLMSRVNALARAVRPRGLVILIQHTEESGEFQRGSAGWQLLPELERHAEDAVLEKSACDSFLETELDALLQRRGVTDLIITGCATDFCVDTTVRSAGGRAYRVIVPSDAHTTADRPHLSAAHVIAHHNYVWADLILPRQKQIRVLPTEALLAELSRG